MGAVTYCVIIVLAILHSYMHGQFFEGGWLPQSTDELISDGIFMLLVAMAFISQQIDSVLKKLKKEDD